MNSTAQNAQWKLSNASLLQMKAALEVLHALNAGDETRMVELINRRFPLPLWVDKIELRLLSVPPRYPGMSHSLVDGDRVNLGRALLKLGWNDAISAFARRTRHKQEYLSDAVLEGQLHAVETLLALGVNPQSTRPRPVIFNVSHYQENAEQVLQAFLKLPSFDPWKPGVPLRIRIMDDPELTRLSMRCLPACALEDGNPFVAALLVEHAVREHQEVPNRFLQEVGQSAVKQAKQVLEHTGAVVYWESHQRLWKAMKELGMEQVYPSQAEELLETWEEHSKANNASLESSNMLDLLVLWSELWKNPRMMRLAVNTSEKHGVRVAGLDQLESELSAWDLEQGAPLAHPAQPSRPRF